MCNDTTCNITSAQGRGPVFLYICGDYTGGVMQVTRGNLVSIRLFCASLYNCTDPANCWMRDIVADEGTDGGILASGVRAVSLMPGCEMHGELAMYRFSHLMVPCLMDHLSY